MANPDNYGSQRGGRQSSMGNQGYGSQPSTGEGGGTRSRFSQRGNDQDWNDEVRYGSQQNQSSRFGGEDRPYFGTRQDVTSQGNMREPHYQESGGRFGQDDFNDEQRYGADRWQQNQGRYGRDDQQRSQRFRDDEEGYSRGSQYGQDHGNAGSYNQQRNRAGHGQQGQSRSDRDDGYQSNYGQSSNYGTQSGYGNTQNSDWDEDRSYPNAGRQSQRSSGRDGQDSDQTRSNQNVRSNRSTYEDNGDYDSSRPRNRDRNDW